MSRAGSLDPARQTKTKRLWVPLTERQLLDRGEFRTAVVADVGGLEVDLQRGDTLQVRQVGRFAVLLHLPYLEGRARVWVGSIDQGRFVWGEPRECATRYLACLEALKLVGAFDTFSVGGD